MSPKQRQAQRQEQTHGQIQDHKQSQRQRQARAAMEAADDIRAADIEAVLGEDRAKVRQLGLEPRDDEESTGLEVADSVYDRDESAAEIAAVKGPRRVEFAIRADGRVVGFARQVTPAMPEPAIFRFASLRRAVVDGIAEHLHRTRSLTLLDGPGAWVNIPIIKSHAPAAPPDKRDVKEARGLIELIRARYQAQFSPKYGHERARIFADQVAGATTQRIRSTPGFLAFAIRLQNDDVIVPHALLKRARMTLCATRAGALRSLAATPATLAGEPWSKADWRGFRNNQKEKATERADASGNP